MSKVTLSDSIDRTDGLPAIAHFNSTYPFLGVDQETYNHVVEKLQQRIDKRKIVDTTSTD